MLARLQDLLSAEYGLRDVRLTAAPRGYVAETYIVATAHQPTYFCKVVNKPIWIPKIIGSLPVLDAIHNIGFERANYPIKTLSGALYVMDGETLIVLYDYIQAEQTYSYDDIAFGRLLGEVHALPQQINVEIPQERFLLKHRDFFEGNFDALLTAQSNDPVIQGLQRVLRQREPEIRRYYSALQSLSAECKQTRFDLVITHGDPGGNVLVKSSSDLYLIDWDEILLAPAERDIWIHDNREAFMAGYRSARPDYQTNELARKYCLCSQYFDYMAYYLSDILSDLPPDDRAAKLQDFERYFEGWIKPYIESIN